MHVKVAVISVVGAVILATLPGCSRIIDWTKTNFYQGEPLNEDIKVAKNYIRSVTLYDEFSTHGMFDVLWLSEVVRTAYAHLYVYKRGEDQTYYKKIIERELFENEQFISFYVLSISHLVGPESEWTLFLRIGNNNLIPHEVKVIELPYEYQQVFAKRSSIFKRPYLVTFSARNIEGIPYITPDTQEISLYVRSAKKQHALSWNIDKKNSSKTIV